MNIIKDNHYILSGVIWNQALGFLNEISNNIMESVTLLQVACFDFVDGYDDFILECYEHDLGYLKNGYIYEKIKNINKCNSNIMIGFILGITNPKFSYHETYCTQCIQARNIKNDIRKNFAPLVEDYIFDNLIHITDNSHESIHLISVFNKYSSYVTKNYVDLRYADIIITINNNAKRYTELNKLLKDIE